MTGDWRSFVGPGLEVFEWHQAIQAHYSRFRFPGAQS